MTDTVENLTVIEGEKSYTVRKLNNGDTRRVAAMVAKVSGDPRLTQALASNDQMLMLSQGLAVCLEFLPEDITLFVANLIGKTKHHDFGKYMAEVRAEERDNNMRYAQPEQEAKRRQETAILDEMDEMPFGTNEDVLVEVMERDDFDAFLVSFSRLKEAGLNAYSRYQIHSKSDTDSETQKS